MLVPQRPSLCLLACSMVESGRSAGIPGTCKPREYGLGNGSKADLRGRGRGTFGASLGWTAESGRSGWGLCIIVDGVASG